VRGQQQRLALLRDRGAPFYTGTIDGVPGPATRSAIRAFQQSRGLAADGVAGSRTQSALESAVAERASSSSDLPELVEFEVQPLPRAGRLLGARRILSGNIAVAEEERLRVHSQIVDTIDGAIVSDAQVERPLSEFHRIPGELVVRTAEGIGIPLDETTRRELLEAPPVTSSLAAFLAYGRGLTYEDQGLWENAAAEYADALRLSPEFDLARQRVEMVRFGTGEFEQSLRRNIAVAAAAQRSRNPVAGRALGAVGAETAESEMRDDAGDLDRAVQTDGAPFGTVRVSGQVPVR
jgi:peptidoglycan hydrolase-like protein with peptidoglycan-binding domain